MREGCRGVGGGQVGNSWGTEVWVWVYMSPSIGRIHLTRGAFKLLSEFLLERVTGARSFSCSTDEWRRLEPEPERLMVLVRMAGTWRDIPFFGRLCVLLFQRVD